VKDKTMNTSKIVRGTEAIELAEAAGLQLHKHADPTEGARELSLDEAREVAKEDPSLVYVAVEGRS